MGAALSRIGIALVVATAALAAPATVAATDGCATYDIWQQDDYVTAASGYRLHGWLRLDACKKGTFPFVGIERRFVFGHDSRWCDGCATHTVSVTRITGKAWRDYWQGNPDHPGVLAYSSKLQLQNAWKVNLVTPWMAHEDELSDPRASATGYQEKTGVFRYSWFRQWL